MAIDLLYADCAGLDVHKKTVVACVLHTLPGGATTKKTRTFGTTLDELERLRDWLREEGCTHVAMEATGVYWKPVHNVLEDHLTIVVGNAEHMRGLRGRKTDVKDAEWIATLLAHGLMPASFIPDRAQRELRELTRFRTSIIHDRARVVNRLQKTLEGANIKLAAVLTDIVGASGQRILDALLRGDTDPKALAELADPRVRRAKGAALEQALLGRLDGRLAFLVRQELQQIRMLDEQIEACDGQIAQEMLPFADELARLDAIPGVGSRSAQVIVAEIGTEVRRFPTARHLAAWAGLCPANKTSAGKRQRAGTRKGNPWLRQALVEAGWAAGRTKKSSLGEQFRQLRPRLGGKRAVVAVGHSILTIVYFLLVRGTTYEDLGVDYVPERKKAEQQRRSVRRLEAMGYHVTLTPVAA